ncbi:MAG: hypothetical protein K9K75_03445, partial [Deltaproteobacteria bacterium]|nr:hypothetical protein [Deltaproteobacteria bacterium]
MLKQLKMIPAGYGVTWCSLDHLLTNFRLLIPVILFSVLLSNVGVAVAARVDITGSQTTPYACDGGNECWLWSDASISVRLPAATTFAASGDQTKIISCGTIINEVLVAAGYSSAIGMAAIDGGYARNEATGVVWLKGDDSSSGAVAYGMVAQGDSATVVNIGNITITSINYAVGVALGGSRAWGDINGNIVITGGNHGYYATGIETLPMGFHDNCATLRVKSATITLTLNPTGSLWEISKSVGILLENKILGDISDSAITVNTSRDSCGIHVGNSFVAVRNSTIVVTGADGHKVYGLYSSGSGSFVTIYGGTTLRTAGIDAHGIHVVNGGRVNLNATANSWVTIDSQSGKSIFVNGPGSEVNNYGNLLFNASSSRADNRVSVSPVVTESEGIFNNYGKIAIHGYYSVGITTFGSGVNSGTVSHYGDTLAD